jgi:PilZ domain-containing protein
MNMEGSAYVTPSDNGGTILNISETGLCFQSTTPVQRTATIHLLFPQENHQVDADGRLPWTDESQKRGGLRFIEVDSELAWMDETRQRGGLRFINLTEEARVEIRHWISQHTMPVTVNEKSAAHTTSHLSIPRLVLVPTLFTLGVTLLSLAGELYGWPSPWFSKNSTVVGTMWWLPPIFGCYFALKLWGDSDRIDRVDRAFALGLLGVLLNQAVTATIFPDSNISIYSKLVILWTVAVLSAYLQYLGWPALCKTLTAYGLGARIPIVVIKFFALRGHWGTHYDRPSGIFTLGFWPEFFWFGFFEELICWVSFTVAIGSLAGSVAAAVAKRRMRESQTAA